MAQAFLEPDFLLRRATPTPARIQAAAASRPAFSIPEPDRAQARSPDVRAQTTRAQASAIQGAAIPNARTRDTGTQNPRPRDARTEDVRPERTVRTGSASTRRAAAPTDADAVSKTSSGKASPGKAPLDKAPLDKAPLDKASLDKASSGETGSEVKGAARDSAAAAPAGATGSPEAAMATAVNAGAGATGEAGAKEAVTDGTEDDREVADMSTEDPDASLLALGFLPPPPPPANPGHSGAPASTAEGEAPADAVPSASGPGQPPAGALKPSHGEIPGVAGEARSGAAMADPAVAVRDAKATAAEISLPGGVSQVRESFDSMLPGASVAPAVSTQTSAASATQTAPPVAPPVPLGAVPMTIGLRSLQGSNHFEIRLDPGDLGRIDVSLDIDKERGTVMAHLVVDRVETLALLQRDTGSLQQALSQAGLDASEANINFSLRSDTQSGGRGADGQGSDGRHPEGRPGGPGLPGQPEGRAALAPVPVRTLRGLTGLDIRI